MLLFVVHQGATKLIIQYMFLTLLLEPQSRFGDKPAKFQIVCPQNGTAVLKGGCITRYQTPLSLKKKGHRGARVCCCCSHIINSQYNAVRGVCRMPLGRKNGPTAHTNLPPWYVIITIIKINKPYPDTLYTRTTHNIYNVHTCTHIRTSRLASFVVGLRPRYIIIKNETATKLPNSTSPLCGTPRGAPTRWNLHPIVLS